MKKCNGMVDKYKLSDSKYHYLIQSLYHFCLEILIKRHKQKLYNFIYSNVQDRDLTEDVFQDTFIKVIRTLKTASIMKKVNLFLG